MASSSTITIFALLVTVSSSLLPSLSSDSADNFLAPLLSPFIGEFCKDVGCGKGKCNINSSQNSDWPYQCECDPGWKQILSSNHSSLTFLPCVIPNCTLDFACSEAAPPAPLKETPSNASILDPCSWANCGGGMCNKTSAFTYTCECKEGYYNLLNNTGFPCFKECSIGGDCTNLGITMSNKSTAPAPNLPDRSANQASSLQHEVFYGMMIMLAIASAVVL